jgi:hypothetical protein
MLQYLLFTIPLTIARRRSQGCIRHSCAVLNQSLKKFEVGSISDLSPRRVFVANSETGEGGGDVAAASSS